MSPTVFPHRQETKCCISAGQGSWGTFSCNQAPRHQLDFRSLFIKHNCQNQKSVLRNPRGLKKLGDKSGESPTFDKMNESKYSIELTSFPGTQSASNLETNANCCPRNRVGKFLPEKVRPKNHVWSARFFFKNVKIFSPIFFPAPSAPDFPMKNLTLKFYSENIFK